jgi:hypothetical protein
LAALLGATRLVFNLQRQAGIDLPGALHLEV